MIQSKIKIRTKNQSYNEIVGNDLAKNLSKILKDNLINFNKCLLVIDSRVPKRFLKKINFLLKKKISLIIFLIQTKLIKIKKL